MMAGPTQFGVEDDAKVAMRGDRGDSLDGGRGVDIGSRKRKGEVSLGVSGEGSRKVDKYEFRKLKWGIMCLGPFECPPWPFHHVS
jgi:hypothetical protein